MIDFVYLTLYRKQNKLFFSGALSGSGLNIRK